jgi:hypothetical protein
MKSKILCLSFFCLISIGLERITGRLELIPFYCWDLFTGINPEISFFKLEIASIDSQKSYSSLESMSDGLNEREKIILSRLPYLSQIQVEDFIRIDLAIKDSILTLKKVTADSLEFYRGKKIKEEVVVWVKKY